MSGTRTLVRQGLPALGVMILTAATLWWSGQTHDAEHAQTLDALTSAGHAQAELQQHALTIRLGALRRYDPLNDDIAGLKEAVEQVEALAPRVVALTPELTDAIAELHTTVQRKQDLVDQYKTQVSKYRNSLTYLPVALQEWKQAGVDLDAHTAVAEDLVRLALTYNATPTDAFHAELADALDLAQQTPVPTQPDSRAAWTLLLAHVSMVQDTTQPLSVTLDALIMSDLRRAVAGVGTSYAQAHHLLMRRRTLLQRVTFGLVLVSALLFGNLVFRLRNLYATLELRIAQRTEELAEVVAGSRRILDNVGEGLVSVSLDGMAGSQASTALRKWLGEPEPGEPIWDWLGRFAPDQAQWFEMGWEDLNAGFMPTEVTLAQLPSRMVLEDRVIGIRYSAIVDGNGDLTRVLLILRDITLQEQAERQSEQSAERLAILMQAMADRNGLGDCMQQTTALLDNLEHSLSDAITSRRVLHTIKGNVGMYEMSHMAKTCHQLETRLDDTSTPVTQNDVTVLRSEWTRYETMVQPFFNSDSSTSRRSDGLATITALIEQRAPYEQLAATAALWQSEATAVRLTRLARQAEQTGVRLERPVDVQVEDGGLNVPPKVLDSLWLAVPHLVRNALDHGIEDPSDRIELGKPELGQLTLATLREGDSFIFRIRDDGAGIRWEALRDKAAALNLKHETQADLEAVLFADGVSSRNIVSQYSGRGIGMAAVRQATVALGGTLTVQSEAGAGTTIECRIPGVFQQASRMAG